MGNARHYEIRLFDRTLVEFSLADGAFGPEVSLADYDGDAAHLMPCGLALNPQGIWSWLESRSIPSNRRYAALICRHLGFEIGDLEALYRVGMGLSLNDSYWVVERGFSGAFADYNLYENAFDERIGMLAVLGETPYETTEVRISPEATTNGTLRKGWAIVSGNRVLYKGATEGFVPGEPISEYIASLIARDLGIDAVEYGLDDRWDQLCSTCANFATKDVSYVPFAVATGMTDLAGMLWWCANRGDESFDAVCDMLAFDALICNTDRHFANFGILRDNATGAFVRMAPVFDNGRGLFPNVADDDTAQFQIESNMCRPAFGGGTFEEQLSRFMGDRQVALLERAGSRGIVGNVAAPGKRVAALDAFVRMRAEDLARVPVVDRAQLLAALESAMTSRAQANGDAFRL